MTGLQKLLIVGGLVATILLRFPGLDKIPPHLSNDEISIAYDAYSILHTGRDEHNHQWPLSFQSHNTYKAPLYIYMATIFNYFLGNSEVSVRLPSAIVGLLTVMGLGYLIYLLTNRVNLAILSFLILALSPWHIYSSRMALEANIALGLFLYAIIFFFIYLKGSSISLIGSSIFFGLSIWAYHTEWILTPIVIGGLIWIYRNKIKFNIYFWISLVIFCLIALPIYNDAWQNRGTNARANTEIVTKDPGVSQIINDENESLLIKIRAISQAIFSNYSNYTKLSYLFFDGLPILPKEDPYTVGLFLAPLLPFFILGLFKIKKYFRNDSTFIYFLVFVSPIVPSLTLGGVNMVRNLTTIIPYIIVISCGLANFGLVARKLKIIFFILLMVSLVFFIKMYFYHFPFEMGENYQYGYRQSADFIKDNYHKYDQIIVDPRFGDVNIYTGVPHLYLAYFTNLDSQKMLSRKETSDGLFFDKYQIRQINWNIEEIKVKTLYLVPFDNFPPERLNNLITVKEIKLPNYKVEFRLLESR